mmetsp:Transcript_97855/g.258446  ORF Transcript_97855/g.258446 Transcript_97855/m.258446 type:complete len:296 (-) Transcript_97855:699-1586(-)
MWRSIGSSGARLLAARGGSIGYGVTCAGLPRSCRRGCHAGDRAGGDVRGARGRGGPAARPGEHDHPAAEPPGGDEQAAVRRGRPVGGGAPQGRERGVHPPARPSGGRPDVRVPAEGARPHPAAGGGRLPGHAGRVGRGAARRQGPRGGRAPRGGAGPLEAGGGDCREGTPCRRGGSDEEAQRGRGRAEAETRLPGGGAAPGPEKAGRAQPQPADARGGRGRALRARAPARAPGGSTSQQLVQAESADHRVQLQRLARSAARLHERRLERALPAAAHAGLLGRPGGLPDRRALVTV